MTKRKASTGILEAHPRMRATILCTITLLAGASFACVGNTALPTQISRATPTKAQSPTPKEHAAITLAPTQTVPIVPTAPLTATPKEPKSTAEPTLKSISITIDSNTTEKISVPDRVTYIDKDQWVTEQAIERIADFLTNQGNGENLFGEMVIIGVYLTEDLEAGGFFEHYEHTNITKRVPIGEKVIAISEKMLTSPEAIEAFADHLYQALHDDGNVTIRKANEQELDWYWTEIGYDIEEPVLVIESTNHRFFFDFWGDTVMHADDYHIPESDLTNPANRL